jgi:hypothetical protein
LRRHVEAWSRFSAEIRRRVVFLVIDDGSPAPDDAASLLLTCQAAVRTVVVRVTEDIAWNIGGARNLIFTVAPTELVFSVDADQLLPQNLVEWALTRKYRATLDNCHIVRGFPRILQSGRKFRVHPGVMLASKTSYWRVGGCDEDFVGHYGHTDVHFNFRCTYDTRGCSIV